MNTLQLINLMNAAVPDGGNKKAFLEVSLAVELAYAFSLPSAPVVSVVAHFDQFHADTAKRVISEINEMYPVSVQSTYNLVVDLYKTRYDMVHEPRKLESSLLADIGRACQMTSSLSDAHRDALYNAYSRQARGQFADYITRHVAPVQTA